MPILNSIRSSRIPNRVNLCFSDGLYLPFFIDDLIKFSLQKGELIDDSKYHLIQSQSLSYLAQEYALRQIAISPKTEKQLRFKIKIFFIKIQRKLKISPVEELKSIEDQIIDNLKQRKLLDQDSFISYFINKNKGKSRSKILFLLSQQGIKVSPSIKEQLDLDNDKALIRKILDKKNINPSSLRDFRFKQKLMASLFRKGFQLSDIQSTIDAYSNLK